MGDGEVVKLEESQIRSVVQEVVQSFAIENTVPSLSVTLSLGGSAPGDGIFESIEDAVDAASRAQQALEEMTLDDRRGIIAAIREAGMAHAKGFAQNTVEETGMGRVPHKIRKFELVTKLTPGVEDLESVAWSGDHGLTVVEMAPFGVAAAITPSTHPVPTIVNNAISLISAGNSVVFNAHPGAKNVSAVGIQIFNRAIVEAGGPPNLLTAVREPTIQTGQALFVHPKINIILVTGGAGVARAALQSPKRAIVAGPGNPPVVVDETADFSKAAQDIITGGGFDNNILCTGEKEIFVVRSVAEELKRQLLVNRCVELERSQIDALASAAFPRDEKGEWTRNREFIGRNAHVLAEHIGLEVPPDTELLIGEVEADHPFVQYEQMMPVMPIVRTSDVTQAIDLAIEAEHGYQHTAVMHSKNVENMTVMARKCRCTLFIKNGPSPAGLGAGGEGDTSFSIATPTGEGVTSARTFTRQRRCTLVDYFRII